jgi:hypothetical protein
MALIRCLYLSSKGCWLNSGDGSSNTTILSKGISEKEVEEKGGGDRERLLVVEEMGEMGARRAKSERRGEGEGTQGEEERIANKENLRISHWENSLET